MIRMLYIALGAVALALFSVLPIEAQPGGSGGGRGGFGRGGMSPDQVFGLLAFDDKFKVTGKQLLELRSSLKPLSIEQREAMAGMFSGDVDFQAVRETMREMQMEMRAKLMGALKETLDEEQLETLKEHMKEQQERRRNFGGGSGPRSGGGRGSGDGGGF